LLEVWNCDVQKIRTAIYRYNLKKEEYYIITFPAVGIMGVIFLTYSLSTQLPGETKDIHETPESR
jgi:hypothetical protein